MCFKVGQNIHHYVLYLYFNHQYQVANLDSPQIYFGKPSFNFLQTMWEYSIVICDIKMYLFHNVSFFLVTDIYNCNRKISTKRNVKVELQEAQYSQFYFTILQFDAFSASLIKWWTIKKCLFTSWFKRKRKLCIGFKSLECAWVEIRLQNANFLSSCYPSQQKSKHKECVMKYRTSYTFQVGCGMYYSLRKMCMYTILLPLSHACRVHLECMPF